MEAVLISAIILWEATHVLADMDTNWTQTIQLALVSSQEI
jgi:hypothetical protein